MELFSLAEQLKKEAKYREAIEKYAIVEHVQPELSVEAGVKKAFCYYRIGEHDEVFRCVENLSQKASDNMLLVDIHAMSLYAIGKSEQAANEYRRLTLSDEANIRHKGYVGIGICLLSLKRFSEGIENLKTALELAVSNSQKKNALHNLGWAEFLTGNYLNAKKYYLQAFELDHEDPVRNVVSFHSLAEAAIEMGEHSDARDNLEKALGIITFMQSRELESENLFLRGKMSMALEDYPGALEYFNRSRKLIDERNVNKLLVIGDELYEIYSLKSNQITDMMRAHVAYELYCIYKYLSPEKAAGFLAVYREIEKKYK